MTRDQIKAILERVLTWPAEAQAEAIASLESIEEEFSGSLELSPADKDALERSGEDVRHGRLASDEKVREVFDHFRRS